MQTNLHTHKQNKQCLCLCDQEQGVDYTCQIFAEMNHWFKGLAMHGVYEEEILKVSISEDLKNEYFIFKKYQNACFRNIL